MKSVNPYPKSTRTYRLCIHVYDHTVFIQEAIGSKGINCCELRVTWKSINCCIVCHEWWRQVKSYLKINFNE